MTEDALRKALRHLVAVLDRQFGGRAKFADRELNEALSTADAALALGEAPEPVAQEPVAPCPHDLAEREMAVADGMCPLCMAAGMDAARAKAIEECAQVCERTADELHASKADRANSRAVGATCCANALRALATPSPLTEKGKNGE